MNPVSERAKQFWAESEQVIGACIEVHQRLGPGLLESAYQACVARELSLRRISVESQVPVPIQYKGVLLDCGYQLDFVVSRSIVLELKAVERLLPVHEAQVITYLKLTGFEVGLLVNFNVRVLREGIRRLTRRAPGDAGALPGHAIDVEWEEDR